MSLKVLMLEEEPEMEVVHVPLASSEENQPEPELPDEYIVTFQEWEDIDDAVFALESAVSTIEMGGMTVSAARALDRVTPGFIYRSGGLRNFTATPSLEGLVEGANAVKDALGETVNRVRKFVATMYKRFRDWLVSRFQSKDNKDLKQEVEEFLSQRRNHDAIKYLTELPEEPSDAADEVALFVDGESKQFASDLADQLQSVISRVKGIEKMMEENPTHFRLARGDITVQDLFKEDADSAINQLLGKASAIANIAMKAGNAEQFLAAMQNVVAVKTEIEEFEKNMVVNDKPSEQHGDDRSVPLDKLYDNIRKVGEDLKRVDIETRVTDMVKSVEKIIAIADEQHDIEKILALIPEEVTERRNRHALDLSRLFSVISLLGRDILRLWKVRADSVGSINKVGDALLGLVSGFEKAVVDASTSLNDEQKQQLSKALLGKGLKVVF
jgi:hypothetical protein